MADTGSPDRYHVPAANSSELCARRRAAATSPSWTPYPASVQFEEAVETRGHLLDSGVLARVLDDVLEYGGDYRIDRLDLGREHEDESYARLTLGAPDEDLLQRLLMRVQVHGVNQVDPGMAMTRPAPRDGVFPDDFYPTTNLETFVRLDAGWLTVQRPEMDCGLRVVDGVIETVPVSDVGAGDLIVCGASGVRVSLPALVEDGRDSFGFMSSAVSSEKPQALLVRQIAQQMRAVRASGLKVLWVGGPAVVHTGAAPAMVALIEAGYVDVLFAGNALATHDIESALYGTSLGVDLKKGSGVPHGHKHHIRAINTIRRCGSIAEAVDQGVLRSGVMHAMVQAGNPFVLVGSVRDDGPLPDVYTDVVEGQRAMRAELPGLGSPSWSPRCCTRSSRATFCRRRCRWSVSTSTRRPSPSWPIADRPRPSASSPTSGCSSSSSPRTWSRGSRGQTGRHAGQLGGRVPGELKEAYAGALTRRLLGRRAGVAVDPPPGDGLATGKLTWEGTVELRCGTRASVPVLVSGQQTGNLVEHPGNPDRGVVPPADGTRGEPRVP